MCPTCGEPLVEELVLDDSDDTPIASTPTCARDIREGFSDFEPVLEIDNVDEVIPMKRSEFAHRWVNNMLESINGELNQEATNRVMECCGRACARMGVTHEVQKCAGDLDGLLSTLRRWVGSNNVSINGNEINVVYDRCFCQLGEDVSEAVADTFCLCSRGWMLEVFETALGRPVEVELESSIKRGADRCRFLVRV